MLGEIETVSVAVLVVGVAVLLLSVVLDGLLDAVLFDGAVPVAAVTCCMFGCVGLVGDSLGVVSGAKLMLLSFTVSLVFGAATWVAYRRLRRSERLAPVPERGDTVGMSGSVLWWLDGRGEVLLDSGETLVRVPATGSRLLRPGDRVLAVGLEGDGDVSVAQCDAGGQD